jgi:mannose-6-phosphate isomerase-like protein (cupin superfamily)
MSPTKANWKPDDSVIEGKPGAARIKAALKKRRVNVTNRVITSRDPGMADILYDLRRPDLPPGIQSWQLPIAGDGGSVFFFLTVAQPGAIVPSHSHKRDLFRVVVSGSITTNGVELKSGDWMYVPAGVTYGYSAALNPGAIVYHCYF